MTEIEHGSALIHAFVAPEPRDRHLGLLPSDRGRHKMASFQFAMDIGAELTLQIARLAHERSDPPRSPAAWMFWPEGRRATWAQARAILADAPKPLLVSPLIEPGGLGLWTLEALDDAARARASAEMRNQVTYYRAKLDGLGLGDADSVRFEAATPPMILSVSAFLRWAGDYALNLGITLRPSPDPGVARVVLRPPGGEGPPLGTTVDPYKPAI